MMQVQATKLGFYGNRRRYPIGSPKSTPFTLQDEKDFCADWMIKVGEKEVVANESNETEIETSQKQTVAEPTSDGGEKSPSDQTESTDETESSELEGDADGGEERVDDVGDESEEVEKLSESALKRLKKDDLIAEAVKLGLSDNIDLTQMTNSQIINLILDSYSQEEGNDEG